MTLTLEGLNLKMFQEIEDLYDGRRHNRSIYGELAKIQQFKFMEFNYIFSGGICLGILFSTMNPYY